MKQVFPDIRPRRLGTRGHSRYCYAAMRKATKLQPPNLPDLTSVNDSLMKSADQNDEDTWKVIKNWSESLLNAQFESVDDLAAHISQNKICMPSTSTSKQLLQKKIMQREIKDRRRNNVSWYSDLVFLKENSFDDQVLKIRVNWKLQHNKKSLNSKI